MMRESVVLRLKETHGLLEGVNSGVGEAMGGDTHVVVGLSRVELEGRVLGCGGGAYTHSICA